MTEPIDRPSYVVRPIGFVRSPFLQKADAPRQAACGADVRGTIDVLPAYEHALADLEGFDRIWIVFWFHEAEGYSAKVLPPRSDTKRGLFATRSPHRPNPIGMSCVRLDRVDGLVVHVRDIDLIDGTPILDLKPYVAYADAFPDARAGWLAVRDPREPWVVGFTPLAEEHLAWIATQGNPFDLRARIEETLAIGPQPHAYRRIKRMTDGSMLLAAKEWRAHFTYEDRRITVEKIASGYRAKELASGDDGAPHSVLDLHRAFVTRFG